MKTRKIIPFYVKQPDGSYVPNPKIEAHVLRKAKQLGRQMHEGRVAKGATGLPVYAEAKKVSRGTYAVLFVPDDAIAKEIADLIGWIKTHVAPPEKGELRAEDYELRSDRTY